jgi:zinc transporter 1/2/3
MQKLNGGKVTYDTHGHGYGAGGMHAAHGPEGDIASPIHAGVETSGDKVETSDDKVEPHDHASHSKSSSIEGHEQSYEEASGPLDDHPLAQILSILILEFGVIFHSFITGITLAVSIDFIPLFLVLIFHQLFEGLGLGTRLAHLAIFKSPRIEAEARAKALESGNSALPQQLPLPRGYAFFPWFGALAFALTLPLGVAVGLGVRNSYDANSPTANIVSGVFDAFSSGILLYTGLVELLAHEFLFSRAMREAPLGRVLYAGFCVMFGAALMSLLGRWA